MMIYIALIFLHICFNHEAVYAQPQTLHPNQGPLPGQQYVDQLQQISQTGQLPMQQIPQTGQLPMQQVPQNNQLPMQQIPQNNQLPIQQIPQNPQLQRQQSLQGMPQGQQYSGQPNLQTQPFSGQPIPNQFQGAQAPQYQPYRGDTSQYNPNLQAGSQNPYSSSNPYSYQQNQYPELQENNEAQQSMVDILSQISGLLSNPATRRSGLSLLQNLRNGLSNPTDLERVLSRASDPNRYIGQDGYSQYLNPAGMIEDFKTSKLGAIRDLVKDVTAAKARAMNRLVGNVPVVGPLTKAGDRMIGEGINAMEEIFSPILGRSTSSTALSRSTSSTALSRSPSSTSPNQRVNPRDSYVY